MIFLGMYLGGLALVVLSVAQNPKHYWRMIGWLLIVAVLLWPASLPLGIVRGSK